MKCCGMSVSALGYDMTASIYLSSSHQTACSKLSIKDIKSIANYYNKLLASSVQYSYSARWCCVIYIAGFLKV